MAKQQRRFKRPITLQSLERRNLLAGDVLHNFLDPLDVNDDAAITAADALSIINELGHDQVGTQHLAEGDADRAHAFWDVNDDGHTSAGDALQVINRLSQDTGQSQSAGKLVAKISGADGERAKFEFESDAGKENLEIKLQNGVPAWSYEVFADGEFLTQLETDAHGRGKVEFGDHYLSAAVDLTRLADGTQVTIRDVGSDALRSDDDGEHGRHDNGDDHGQDHHEGTDSVGDLHSTNDDGHGDHSSIPAAANATVANPTFGKWNARLAGLGNGKAEFEHSAAESKFEIEIRGARASHSYVVSLNGTVVGQLTTNDRGDGTLKFDSHDAGRPFPANFPRIDSEVSVNVGSDLSGSFASSTHSEASDDGHHETNDDDHDDHHTDEHGGHDDDHHDDGHDDHDD